jgi:hypothetical protein
MLSLLLCMKKVHFTTLNRFFYVMGQCHEIFDLRFYHQKVLIDIPFTGVSFVHCACGVNIDIS